MPRLIGFELVRKRGTRADQAHLAANHVDQLRQLVEAEAAQNPPNRRDAIVTGQLEHLRVAPGPVTGGGPILDPALDILAMRRIGGGNAHRAQLEHLERIAAHTDALLAKQHWPAVKNPYGQGRKRKDGRGECEYERSEGDVEGALEHEVQPFDIRAARTYQGHRTEHLDADPSGRPTRNPRHQRPPDVVALAQPGNALL